MTQNLVPVEKIDLFKDKFTKSYLLILHCCSAKKILPITIGNLEADSIAMALQGIRIHRPLTHDLFLNTVIKLKGKINKIVIEKLENNTYYASMDLTQNSTNLEIDMRPSDAIGIGIRAKVPIFIKKELLEKAGQQNPFIKKNIARAKQQFSPEEIEKISKLLEEARKKEKGNTQN